MFNVMNDASINNVFMSYKSFYPLFHRQSPSGLDFIENIKYKVWFRIGVEAVEIIHLSSSKFFAQTFPWATGRDKDCRMRAIYYKEI